MTTTKCFKRKYKKLKARFDAVTHTQRTITEKQISCNSLAARLTSETYYILDLLGDITPVIDTPPYPDLDTRIRLGEGGSGGSTGGTIGIGGIGGIEIDDYWRTASPSHFHDLNFDDPEPSQTAAVPPLLKKRTPSSRTPGPNSITQGIDDSYAERTPVSKREREDKEGEREKIKKREGKSGDF